MIYNRRFHSHRDIISPAVTPEVKDSKLMYYRGMRLRAKSLGRSFPGVPTRYLSRPRRFASFPSCTCLRRTGGLKECGITRLGLDVAVGPGIPLL